MENNQAKIQQTYTQQLNQQGYQQKQPNEQKKQHPPQNAQQQDLITDFSSMFKKKGNFTKRPAKNKTNQSKTPNWLLQIPAKLDVTLQDLQRKSVLDLRKWMCVVKAGQRWLKPIAAVCSCWNYMCSGRGLGKGRFLSVKACLDVIGQKITVQELKNIQQFNRYGIIQRIVSALNASQQVGNQIQISLSVKLAEPNKLKQQVKAQKESLLKSIQNNNQTFIYLAYQDIFCLIGYDKTPLKQLQAYEKIQNISEQNQQLWMINSTLGRNQPSFCIKRWTDVQKDLETVWPNYLDIKQPKLGVRVRPDANQHNSNQNRGNSNCIIKLALK